MLVGAVFLLFLTDSTKAICGYCEEHVEGGRIPKLETQAQAPPQYGEPPEATSICQGPSRTGLQVGQGYFLG